MRLIKKVWHKICSLSHCYTLQWHTTYTVESNSLYNRLAFIWISCYNLGAIWIVHVLFHVITLFSLPLCFFHHSIPKSWYCTWWWEKYRILWLWKLSWRQSMLCGSKRVEFLFIRKSLQLSKICPMHIPEIK
jgi:hypothetical protein